MCTHCTTISASRAWRSRHRVDGRAMPCSGLLQALVRPGPPGCRMEIGRDRAEVPSLIANLHFLHMGNYLFPHLRIPWVPNGSCRYFGLRVAVNNRMLHSTSYVFVSVRSRCVLISTPRDGDSSTGRHEQRVGAILTGMFARALYT